MRSDLIFFLYYLFIFVARVAFIESEQTGMRDRERRGGLTAKGHRQGIEPLTTAGGLLSLHMGLILFLNLFFKAPVPVSQKPKKLHLLINQQ